MTKEEALKVLDTIPTIGEQVDALEMAIRALENEPVWISVSDRLPANGNTIEKEYLVQLTNDCITILNYYDGWNCFVDKDGIWHNENEITDILFWMELPKPKEVDGDDE